MNIIIKIFLFFLISPLFALPKSDGNLKHQYLAELEVMWNNVYNKKLDLTPQELSRLNQIEKYANHIDDIDVYYRIAVVYMNTPMTEPAIDWMLKAALGGHPYGMHNAAYWAEHGEMGIRVNEEIAMAFYETAYKTGGLARSGYNLARIYRTSKKNRDYSNAVDILHEIVDDTSENALIIDDEDIIKSSAYDLGYMYRYNMGTDDIVLDKAIKYFKIASDYGHLEAKVDVGNMLRTKYRKTGNEALNIEARELYVEAAENGIPDGMVFLGMMLAEEGKKEKSELLFKKANGWFYLANKIGVDTDQLKTLLEEMIETMPYKIKNNLEILSKECIKNNYQNCFQESFNLQRKTNINKHFFEEDIWTVNVADTEKISPENWNVYASVNSIEIDDIKFANEQRFIFTLTPWSDVKCSKANVYVQLYMNNKYEKYFRTNDAKKIIIKNAKYDAKIERITEYTENGFFALLRVGRFDIDSFIKYLSVGKTLEEEYESNVHIQIKIDDNSSEILNTIDRYFSLTGYRQSLTQLKSECKRLNAW